MRLSALVPYFQNTPFTPISAADVELSHSINPVVRFNRSTYFAVSHPFQSSD